MGKFTLSVFINRPQQEVFDFLSDPANLSKWSSAFESAEWTSNDAHGIGSTYRVSAKLLGSKKEGLFEILQWDRPNCYSYKMNQRAFPLERMESAITLSPKNNGTQVTFESHFELVRILKFAEGFFANMEGWTSQDWFRFAPKKAEPVNDLFRLSTGSLTILRSATNIADFLKISDVLGILMQNQLVFCSRKTFSIT